MTPYLNEKLNHGQTLKEELSHGQTPKEGRGLKEELNHE